MNSRRARDRRRAIALVGVMVALLVTMGLMGSVVRSVIAESRFLRDEERNAQADLLARAGVERARAALAADSAHRGETWQLPPEAVGGNAGAKIEIAVEPGDAEGMRVIAIARYPADARYPAIGRATIEVDNDSNQ